MTNEIVAQLLVYTFVEKDSKSSSREERSLGFFEGLQRRFAADARKPLQESLQAVPGFDVLEQRPHQNASTSKGWLAKYNLWIHDDDGFHTLIEGNAGFYVIISVGLFLTAFGSGYYHLDPNNDRLMWDRLPMTIVVMSLVAALIAERISLRVGLWLLPVLLVTSISSVVQWHMSEMRGAGDLRS